MLTNKLSLSKNGRRHSLSLCLWSTEATRCIQEHWKSWKNDCMFKGCSFSTQWKHWVASKFVHFLVIGCSFVRLEWCICTVASLHTWPHLPSLPLLQIPIKVTGYFLSLIKFTFFACWSFPFKGKTSADCLWPAEKKKDRPQGTLVN